MLTAIAGPDALALWSPGGDQGRGHVARWPTSPSARGSDPLHADLVPLPRAAAPAGRRLVRRRRPPTLVAGLVADVHLRRASTARPCVRSLITLKALTYEPTGGIVAAADHLAARGAGRQPQLGLPLLLAPRRHLDPGVADARRATTTRPWPGGTGCCGPWPATSSKLQIMYGAGRGAPPRRVGGRLAARLRGLGPGAGRQRRRRPVPARRVRRGDVGPVLGPAQGTACTAGPPGTCRGRCWRFLEDGWQEPDDGIWEVRGPRRHFTHSKVMAWVAVDRAVRTSRSGRPRRARSSGGGQLRDEIHAEVCDQGLQRRTAGLHPVLRLRRSSTPACS